MRVLKAGGYLNRLRQLFSLAVAVAVPLLPVLASAAPHEYGVDRPGFDYLSFELSAPRAALCERRCTQEERCKAWTYVKPGVLGKFARCSLKTRVPAPYPDRNCISGVK